MPYQLLCLLLILAAATLKATESKFRTFTDPQGREMDAKLTLVSKNDVFIERRDGLTTKVDISIFSEEDQKFIRNWEKKSALTGDGVGVLFKTHISDKSGYEANGGIERKTWKEGYEIEIENNSAFEMKNVHIKYLVLKFEDALAAQKRSEGVLRQLKGTAKIGTIEKYSKAVTETEQFPMLQTKLQPGYHWSGGGKKRSKDTLEGIWVKVYAGDLLVAEVTKPENLDRNIKWD